MRLRHSQFSVKTLMLVVAAVATNFAAASLLLTFPFLRNTRAAAIVVGLFAIGILLPALWLGAARRLRYDALLAHIAVVGALAFLFLSAVSTEALTAVALFALVYFAVAILIPSVAWYFVRVMESGEPRDRANRLVVAYIKVVAQFSFGFGVWLICFLIVYRIIG